MTGRKKSKLKGFVDGIERRAKRAGLGIKKGASDLGQSMEKGAKDLAQKAEKTAKAAGTDANKLGHALIGPSSPSTNDADKH